MAANPLSDYANNLDPRVKKRYYENISCIGIDPIQIPWVEFMDLRLLFLVLETSSYGKDQSFSE